MAGETLLLKDGKEFLFTGDIAWNTEAITYLTSRPYFIALLLGENRDSVANQIRFLYDFFIENTTSMNLIVAHDKKQFENYVNKKIIGDRFE